MILAKKVSFQRHFQAKRSPVAHSPYYRYIVKLIYIYI